MTLLRRKIYPIGTASRRLNSAGDEGLRTADADKAVIRMLGAGTAGDVRPDNELMTKVHLQGRLVCRDEEETVLVTTHLPRHVELTRTENGCISFTVTPTDDPLVWRVNEVFQDAAAFRRHQDRVRDSEWGHATAPIERDYTIDGL